MRFRPLGPSGMVVSAVSLALADSAARARATDWVSLIYAAFENGINAFEVTGRHPAIADGLSQALQAVERRLLFIAWRIGTKLSPAGGVIRDFSADGLEMTIEAILARTGIEYIDAVILDDPNAADLSPQALEVLRAMRADGRIHMLGVGGRDDALDAYISTGAFDLLHIPFSLTSGYTELRRLKAAVERDMAVIGYDYFPSDFHERPAPADLKKTLWGRATAPLAGAGTYDFLQKTRNWSPEEVCLAYALTQPALATVQIGADRPERIEALAAVTDRELPPGVSAQIEMARFGVNGADGKARKA
jgi:aryl-alcohol dehydrogenase-like predicted oxidoreductase